MEIGGGGGTGRMVTTTKVVPENRKVAEVSKLLFMYKKKEKDVSERTAEVYSKVGTQRALSCASR